MPALLGREVGPIGYGLHNHTMGQSPPSEEEVIESMCIAAELGCLLWNGAEFYGKPDYNSLVLLNRFFTRYPEYKSKVVLNIKGAQEPNFVLKDSPEFVKQSVANCVIVRIAAVEIELSLWCTDPLRNGIVSTCAELDIPT